MSAKRPAPPARRPPPPPTPEEQALRNLRRLGYGLLAAAFIIDVTWEQITKVRSKKAMLEWRMRRAMDPPGTAIAAMGISLLDSASGAGGSPNKTR